MNAEDIPAVSSPKDLIHPFDDDVFVFNTIEWIDVPLLDPNSPETSPEANIRAKTELEYRKSTTPANWHRYLTLGRHSVDGFTFDASMEDYVADPLKLHGIVWYQYIYHLDHDIDIPDKLLAWATQRSQQYLNNHADSALILDTKKVTWNQYARIHSLSDNWSTADKKHSKKHPKPGKGETPVIVNPYKKTPVPNSNTTSTQASRPNSANAAKNGPPSSTKFDQVSVDPSAVSNGTNPSLIMTPNVKVCDGTKRVTFRLKLPLDEFRLFRVPATMKDAVYKFLNKLFSDDDGCLYDWSHIGTDKFGTISQMTPDQVRQFICPSITLMPDTSLVILPVRFGFTGQSPSKWRNLESTQAALDDYNATVSFSNATSTSGKLVIAGYVLYKAPMTTHRKRWLDYLRTQLDEDTPPFDILLHKRAPTGEKGKIIPHLAIQCGETHVHSLSEALAALLTGDKFPLYLPRFSFKNMTPEEAFEIFLDHDEYVKDYRSYPLAPLLRNLDRPRKEYHSDGKVIERTAREWARSLETSDGTYMKADVVNGGDDLLCYLVFPSIFHVEASQAIDHYRSVLYPFTQREARFRESVGPPQEVHLSKRVIANLDFVKRRIAARQQSHSSAESSSANESTSTTSSVSQVSRPATPAESLRRRYCIAEQGSEELSTSSTSAEINSTSTTTAASSKHSTGQLSSQSAQLRDLQSGLHRQKKVQEKQESQYSDRFSTIERQLYRFNDLDTKLSAVHDDFSYRLNLLEGRVLQSVKEELKKSSAIIDTRMDRLMSAVESVVASQKGITDATLVLQKAVPSVNSDSSSNASKSSMSMESTGAIQSPDHKRQKSGGKQSKKFKLKDSIRRALDNRLLENSEDSILSLAKKTAIPRSDSEESMDHLFRQMDEIAQHTSRHDFSSTSETQDHERQTTAGQEPQVDAETTTSTGRVQ
jgi:hypothetical protein